MAVPEKTTPGLLVPTTNSETLREKRLLFVIGAMAAYSEFTMDSVDTIDMAGVEHRALRQPRRRSAALLKTDHDRHWTAA
jgi:hypothetical protein